MSPILHGDSKPHVLGNLHCATKLGEALRALCQHLERVVRGPPHDLEYLPHIVERNLFVKEVRHRIYEVNRRLLSGKGLP